MNPSTYIRTIVKTARVKKAGEPEACQTIYTEVCAGDGEYKTCTVKTTTVCENIAPPDDGIDPNNWITGGGNGSTPPIIPTGDSPSDEDKEIIDSLQGYPCAQAILAKLPNLQNRISEWLSREFKQNIDNTIIFRASTKLDANVDGLWTGNEAGTSHTIGLNATMLSKASQEYIAATMFHESLHGFLTMEKQRLKSENKESQFGILYPGYTEITINGQLRFVKDHNAFGTLLVDLAAALRSFNPNLSEYDAMALSKVGVVENLNTIEDNIAYNHREGKHGTTCSDY